MEKTPSAEQIPDHNFCDRRGNLIRFVIATDTTKKDMRTLFVQAIEYIEAIQSGNPDPRVVVMIDISVAIKNEPKVSYKGLRTASEFLRNPVIDKIAVVLGPGKKLHGGIMAIVRIAGISNLKQFSSQEEAVEWLQPDFSSS